MNVIKFIKKFGWELAQRDIAALESGFIKKEDFLEHYGFDILDDLKCYVDAYELVSKYKNRDGGVRFRVRWGMFRYGDTKEFNENLKQAISIVEEVENYNEKTKEVDPS